MITYDKAKEAWLAEVFSDQLQQLPEGFLAELRKTIELVEKRLAEPGQNEIRKSLLAEEKLKLESFLKQMLEIRCAKLALGACNRQAPVSLDGSERELFESLMHLIDSYKERFYRLSEEQKASLHSAGGSLEPTCAPPRGAERTALGETPNQPQQMGQTAGRERNQILRVVRDFPCFVGPDLRNYGPFAKEDIVALPPEVSGILLGRKAAERVRPAGE